MCRVTEIHRRRKSSFAGIHSVNPSRASKCENGDEYSDSNVMCGIYKNVTWRAAPAVIAHWPPGLHGVRAGARAPAGPAPALLGSRAILGWPCSPLPLRPLCFQSRIPVGFPLGCLLSLQCTSIFHTTKNFAAAPPAAASLSIVPRSQVHQYKTTGRHYDRAVAGDTCKWPLRMQLRRNPRT